MQIIPRGKSGGQEFSEAFQPYIQLLAQTMLKQKLEEQQRQKNIQYTQQLFPNLFQQTAQVPTAQGQQTVAYSPAMGKIPTQYRFRSEKAGEDTTFNPITGEMLFKGVSPLEKEYKKSQLDLNKAYIGYLSGEKVKEEDLSSQIPPGENIEDYLLKPTITKVRGIPKKTFIAERKPIIPTKELTELKDIDVNISDLKSNLTYLEKKPEIKNFIGPGIVQRPGAIADIVAQLGGAPKDFLTFKAKTDLTFQKYRKWVTGVQAGYPELQWIVVDYPKATDTAENYVSKAQNAIVDMERNKTMFLDYLSKAGFATGKFKQPTSGNAQLPTGFNSDEWEVVPNGQ